MQHSGLNSVHRAPNNLRDLRVWQVVIKGELHNRSLLRRQTVKCPRHSASQLPVRHGIFRATALDSVRLRLPEVGIECGRSWPGLESLVMSNAEDPGRKAGGAVEARRLLPDHHHHVIQCFLNDFSLPNDVNLCFVVISPFWLVNPQQQKKGSNPRLCVVKHRRWKSPFWTIRQHGAACLGSLLKSIARPSVQSFIAIALRLFLRRVLSFSSGVVRLYPIGPVLVARKTAFTEIPRQVFEVRPHSRQLTPSFERQPKKIFDG